MLISRSFFFSLAALTVLPPGAAVATAPSCANDTGLTLAAGFCATVFADQSLVVLTRLAPRWTHQLASPARATNRSFPK